MIKLSYVLKNHRNIVVLKGEKLFRNVHFQKICSSLFNLLSSGTVISFQKVVYCKSAKFQNLLVMSKYNSVTENVLFTFALFCIHF